MDKKNNKNLIIILITIIVILSILCILLATGAISFKSNDLDNNETKNNVINNIIENNTNIGNNIISEPEEKVYHAFIIDNENKTNSCHNFNEKDYYRHQNYSNIVNNINIKNNNYSFKFEKDYTNKKVKIYLNDILVEEYEMIPELLLDVCNYGNYIVFSLGWEGPDNYYIINTEGKKVMGFKGINVTYSNGILNVEELDRKNPFDYDDNELIKYQLNMNSDNLQKENVTIEKYECDKESTYDC